MRKRYGITYDEDEGYRTMTATVTGEMIDGTKVWTECDAHYNLIDLDKQYTLQTRNHWSEFVRL